MTFEENLAKKSFLLFALGKKRFALPADCIAELVGLCHLHLFRHTTPSLLGVLLRRGRIVPVWDLARMISGRSLAARKFHLIVKHKFGETTEWIGLPVTGDCEILSGLEPFPAGPDHPPYVCGLLLLVEEVVELLDLDKLPTSNFTDAQPCGMEVHA